MAKKGRPPKPTALHVLNGNPSRKSDLGQHEPRPTPVAPDCPAWLSADARTEWDRVTPELERLGLLTVVDMVSLAAYCQSYARWVEAERVLSEKGITHEYTNKAGETNVTARPEVGIADKYLKHVKAFCSEFGLSPSSRVRIRLPSDVDDDPMEGLLSR